MKSKFEQLIEHIINDEEDRAREMFHNLVVEKSREIYNELVAEEVEMDDEESYVSEMDTDQTDDMMGDIASDEEGMGMDDMDNDDMDDMDNDDMDDMSDDDMGDEEGGDIQDRVMDLEDALDELQRDFQKIVDKEAGDEDEKEMPDNMMREYTEKVSVSHSDGSDNSKSPVSGKNDMGGSAKNIAQGGTNEDPDGKQYKKPSNQYTKGEGNLPGAGSYENVPGAKAGKAFSNAKKPVSKDAASGTHSPVAKK